MPSAGRTSPQIRSWACAVSLSLLPSFVQASFRVEEEGQVKDAIQAVKRHDTSYLDGLRGFVALLVFVRHFALPWQPDLDYGYCHDEHHTSLLRLPVLRLLYAGPNVPVMLVVSGFVLSLKPFKLARVGRWDSLYQACASSIFRRAIRLFPPPIISTFLVAIAVQMGLFEFPYTTLPGKEPRHPLHRHDLLSQVMDWCRFVLQDLTNPWTWKSPRSLYGAHLWTTPLQFRCSMVLMLLLVCFTRLRVTARRILAIMLLVYTFGMGRWDVALYINGMIMADMCVLRRPSELLDAKRTHVTYMIKKPAWLAVRIAVLVCGLYFASFPRQRTAKGAPGYEWVHAISHDYHVWHALGAIILLWSLSLLSMARSVFNTRPTQYLGKISFSLYIIHEPILHVYGIRCVELAWRLTGNSTQLRYQAGFLLGLAMTLPVVIWAADLFYMLVDRRFARLSAWLDEYSARRE